MTDPNQPPAWQPQPGDQAPGGYPVGAYPVDPSAPQVPYRPQGSGELGQIRSTGTCILLFIVTLGIYSFVWMYKTHEEMKRHSGNGVGGGVALIVWFFISPVMAFLHSSEVGKLYERQGQPAPVTGLNGLWFFPGSFIIVGPIVWFVRTNNALNDYWRAMGAQG